MRDASAVDPARPSEPRAFRLAGRLVQPHLNRIVGDAGTLQVEPKIMHVLLCLAQRPGEVVTKTELIERVWQGVFVTDDVLVRAIGELRKALEDEAAPRVIETIRKRGYRLLAPVVHELSRAPAVQESARPSSPRRTQWPWVLAAAVALAFAVLLLRRGSVPPRPRFVPLTSLVGNEFDPVPSPDGTHVVFAWDGGQEDRPTSIYAKVVGAETTLRLTEGADDRAPVWSPDGSRVAFVRSKAGECEIDLVSALGGPAQRLIPCTNRHHPRIHFAPDGKSLLATRAVTTGASSSRLVSVPLDGRPERPLTAPGDGVVDTSPIASPNGTRVAFIRELSEAVGDLYVVPLPGGDARRITHDNADLMGFAWLDDDRLVLSSNRAGMFSLWTVAAGGGEPELLAGGGRKIKHPSASRAGGAVAYEAWEYEMNVWRVELPASGPSAGSAFAAATDEWSFEPRLSPDGTRLAFVSTRSGSYELWVANSAGEELVRLTSFGGPYVGQPRWSPDGKRLAFVGRPAGHGQVFAVDAAGGAPAAVTSASSDAQAPSWSHDGTSIYFASRASGTWQVRARGPDGSGERQVTQSGGYAALESPDGRWLYFSRIDRPGLWRQPAGGGTEESVTSELRPEHWACWGLSDAGVYWLVPSAGDSLEVRLLRPGATGPDTIARLAELAWPGLELSRDGRTLFYSRVGRHASNLVLMALERGPSSR